MVPQIADEIRRAHLEIIFRSSGDTAHATHRLNDLVLRFFDFDVLRHGEGHDQFFGFRVALLEVAERDDGEYVYAWADEQTLVMLKDADNFVEPAIDAHRFADGIRVGKERFANGRAQNHDGTRVLLIERADEAAALDGE